MNKFIKLSMNAFSAVAGLYLIGFVLHELPDTSSVFQKYVAPLEQIYSGFHMLAGLVIAFFAILLFGRGLKVKKQDQELEMNLRLIDLQHQAISAHAIVSIADRDSKIVEVNKNFETAFGYTADEIIGKDHSIVYSNRSGATEFSEVRDCIVRGEVWAGEQKLVDKNGSVLIMQSTIIPLFDGRGNHVRTMGMRTDVTKQRKAEAKKVLNSILENLSDEVYIYTSDTLEVLYMNKVAQDRCEWRPGEATSTRITDTYSLFASAEFQAHIEPVISGKTTEVSFEVLSGETPLEMTTRLNDGPDGAPVLVTFLRDITERKRAEHHKLQSVSLVSHELRTPLTSIKGALRLLQSGAVGDLSTDVLQIVEIAERNSERLLRVVNDILDYEKFNSGEFNLAMESIDLEAFLQEAATANKGYADEYGVHFIPVADKTAGTVSADPDRLMQVMSNLMSNAAKFSPKNSRVDLFVKDIPGFWRICVKDSGPGIPEEARRTLFDMFVQAAPADGKKRPGTGLGLAITKKIVESHGGTIGFESAAESGTTFYFDLPKASATSEISDMQAYATAAE